MRDPRSSGTYTKKRREWLNGFQRQPAPCCMCPGLVDTSLPGTHPDGPTIEHTLPIRTILAEARTYREAVAIACDTSLWALAHKRCQSRQGQAVTAETNRQRNEAAKVLDGASRVW